jgi:hypothetical protein
LASCSEHEDLAPLLPCASTSHAMPAEFSREDDLDVKDAPSPREEKDRILDEPEHEITASPIVLKAHDYPPISFASFSAFTHSLGVRLKAIFTKRFIACLVWGQVLSLCIVSSHLLPAASHRSLRLDDDEHHDHLLGHGQLVRSILPEA